MDDVFEQPTAASVKTLPVQPDDEEAQSSGDEDGGLDWTKLPTGLARPVIPKRGEKDFEPSAAGGSGLQMHVLDRARAAMFEALKATRSTSSKNISYGIWYPSISRAHVTAARGIHFSNMGHSVARESAATNNADRVHKRLELLPEEALYLVERGAMFCWKHTMVSLPPVEPGLDEVSGAPMSVQQAFAEMIGKEDLTLERYQVFAYLKRLGYVVTRTRPTSSAYPIPPPLATVETPEPSLLNRISASISRVLTRLRSFFSPGRNWYHPLSVSKASSYSSLFRSMRFLSVGHKVPLHNIESNLDPKSPYTIFYNLYKPSTHFRKTVPPSPDFSVVVINARTTPMPSIYELSALFDILPELPPPLPRVRPPAKGQDTAQKLPSNTPTAPKPVSVGMLGMLQSWVLPQPPAPLSPTVQVRKPNPFVALKAGKKTVVIAVIDSGNIGFYRFGQGAFEDWPMQ